MCYNWQQDYEADTEAKMVKIGVQVIENDWGIDVCNPRQTKEWAAPWINPGSKTRLDEKECNSDDRQ